MRAMNRARAVLLRLTARGFGRPVPARDVEEALRLEGLDPAAARAATRELVTERAAQETPKGLLPTSLPIKTRAPDEIASFSRLHL